MNIPRFSPVQLMQERFQNKDYHWMFTGAANEEEDNERDTEQANDDIESYGSLSETPSKQSK